MIKGREKERERTRLPLWMPPEGRGKGGEAGRGVGMLEATRGGSEEDG